MMKLEWLRLLRIARIVLAASCAAVTPSAAQSTQANLLEGRHRTGFAGSVGPGACVLELDLGKGESWGKHLLIDGRATVGIKPTNKGRGIRLVSAVRPQQTLQIDVVVDGQPKWLDQLRLNDDIASWPNDLPCKTDTSETDPTWIATTDVGMRIDTFAGEVDLATGKFEVPTEVLARPLAVPTLNARPAGWSAWGGGALWLDMQFGYSVNPSISCNRNPAPDYCAGGRPGPNDVADIIQGANSVQVFVGPRLEFATLGADSAFPTRVYARGVLGSIWLLGSDGKARDHHRMTLGLRLSKGKLRDTFMEGGRALNELVTRDNEAHLNRWFLAGGVYYAPGGPPEIVSRITGKWPPTRIFLRVAYDRAKGPDFLQTALGLTLDFSALAAPFNAGVAGK